MRFKKTTEAHKLLSSIQENVAYIRQLFCILYQEALLLGIKGLGTDDGD